MAHKTETLREYLEDSGRFEKLLEFFVQKHCCEEVQAEDDQEFREFYSSNVRLFADEARRTIAALAGSPIERIFLNSLLLGFTKSDPLGLVVHPAYTDTPNELREFLDTLTKFRGFIAWYRQKFGDFKCIHGYLDEQVARGSMSSDERGFICCLMVRYFYLDSSSTFHLTIQPRFPDLLGNRSIRPDLLFWIPNAPDFRVVVECDGFAYHSSKESFTRDRKRDRALAARGYEVLRFSGAEIFHNPVEVSTELANHLYERRKKYLPDFQE